MAMPEDTLSTYPVPSRLVNNKDHKVSRLHDYEMGGVDFNDPSEGHLVKEWHFYVTFDRTQIRVVAPGIPDTLLYTGENISEISGTFDQNMRPTFVFVEDSVMRMEWYDTNIPGRVLTTYGTEYKSPKVSLDDKRLTADAYNDIIFAYIKGGGLYHRRQRDRYLDEIVLYPFIGDNYELQSIGMGENNRFTFCLADRRTLED